MIKITLIGDPLSVNQTYRVQKKRGKMLFSDEAMEYGKSVNRQAKVQHRGPPLKQDLEVIYHYYFRNLTTARDHLNFNKLLNDRLNQIVWMDDSQIKISHHYTFVDYNNPRVELFINTILWGPEGRRRV